MCFGNFESLDGALATVRVQLVAVTGWAFAATSDDDADADLAIGNVDIFVKRDSDRTLYAQLEPSSATIGSVALSTDGVVMKLWYVTVPESTSGDAERVTDVRVNLRAPLPTGATKWTPAAVLRRIGAYWCSAQLSYGDYWDDTELAAAQTRMELAGVESRVMFSERTPVASVISQVVTGTGLMVWLGSDGKVHSNFFSNDVAATTIGGFPSAELRRDVLHAVEMRSVSGDLTSAETLMLGPRTIATTATSPGVTSRPRVRVVSNLSESGARSGSLNRISGDTTLATLRRWSVTWPLLAAADVPGTVIRLTERWTGITAQPVLIESVTIDPLGCTVTEGIRDLAPYTNTGAYVLFDEYKAGVLRGDHLSPGFTINVTTASGVVYWTGAGQASGDAVTIVAGDVLEVWTATNQYSAKVTVAPTWDAVNSRWQMTVGSVADAIETTIVSWAVRVSWLTAAAAIQQSSGFICDASDGQFSNNDNGKVMVA
jgi:hypothetical protein